MNTLNSSVLSRPPSLASLAEGRLREAIENAEFQLGESLSEDKLATFLGVSRTPVREALNSLSLQGLVEIFPQRGSYVFSPSGDEVQQLCEFRMMMEAKAMVFCLERSKTETARKLVEANSRMTAACESQNSRAIAESDTAFHMTFFEGCANKYLQQAYSLVSGRITALRTHLVNPNTGISPQAVKEHSEIIDAFVAGDIASAEGILSAHIYKMHRNYEIWKSNLPKVEEKATSAKRVRK